MDEGTTNPARADGRAPFELRPLRFVRGFIGSAPGSCLAECGRTRVLCTATVENGVPAWLAGRGQGWLTAEYGMLPGSTGKRKPRDGRRGGPIDGRSVEIQRLIGRAFRPVVDLRALGEFTVYLDCDVLEADGGTRVTAINGAFVALRDLFLTMKARGQLAREPLLDEVAAVSVGVVDGRILVDLAAVEDQRADADMNVVMTGSGHVVEVQAAAEGRAFPLPVLSEAIAAAAEAIQGVIARRRDAFEGPPS